VGYKYCLPILLLVDAIGNVLGAGSCCSKKYTYIISVIFIDNFCGPTRSES
jgi:hypothetical protein